MISSDIEKDLGAILKISPWRWLVGVLLLCFLFQWLQHGSRGMHYFRCKGHSNRMWRQMRSDVAFLRHVGIRREFPMAEGWWRNMMCCGQSGGVLRLMGQGYCAHLCFPSHPCVMPFAFGLAVTLHCLLGSRYHAPFGASSFRGICFPLFTYNSLPLARTWEFCPLLFSPSLVLDCWIWATSCPHRGLHHTNNLRKHFGINFFRIGKVFSYVYLGFFFNYILQIKLFIGKYLLLLCFFKYRYMVLFLHLPWRSGICGPRNASAIICNALLYLICLYVWLICFYIWSFCILSRSIYH